MGRLSPISIVLGGSSFVSFVVRPFWFYFPWDKLLSEPFIFDTFCRLDTRIIYVLLFLFTFLPQSAYIDLYDGFRRKEKDFL